MPVKRDYMQNTLPFHCGEDRANEIRWFNFDFMEAFASKDRLYAKYFTFSLLIYSKICFFYIFLLKGRIAFEALTGTRPLGRFSHR